MREQEARFGELRALLQRAPSVDRFEALAGLLAGWPDPEHRARVVLPYVEGRLRGWPDELRDMRGQWSWRIEPEADAAWVRALVRALEMHAPVTDRQRELGQAGALGQLRQLALVGFDKPASCAGVLEEALEWVERPLRELSLRACFLNAEAAALMLGAPACQELEALSLVASYKPSATNLLASSSRLGSVRRLELRGDLLRAEDLILLCEAPMFVGLEQLHVGGLLDARGVSAEPVVYAVCEALNQSPRVERLGLTSLELTPDGARAIARSRWAPGLRVLELPGSKLGRAQLRALLGEGSRLEQLTHLRLRDWNLEDAALRALVEAPRVGQLTHLHMTGCSLEERQICLLFEARPGLVGLEHLALSNALLDERAARAIAASDHLTRLRTLALVNCYIASPRVLEALVHAPWIDQLEALDVRSAWGLEGADVRAALEPLADKIPSLYLSSGSDSETVLPFELPG